MTSLALLILSIAVSIFIVGGFVLFVIGTIREWRGKK